MTAKQTPQLMISGLTQTIYAVTRYVELDGLTEAREKHDVTRDFLAVAAQIDKPAADILADALGFEITTKATSAVGADTVRPADGEPGDA